MRLVVDTNFLEADEFRDYLSDPENLAVIPDLAIVETLAGRDLPSIYRQLQHLTGHSKQAIILKSTTEISGLRPRKRSRGLQQRLIDKKQTLGFSNWSAMLSQAEKGNKNLQAQLSKKGDMAIEDLANIAKKQETYVKNLAEHAKKYTDAELKILRKREPVTPELFGKITEHILELARSLFASDPRFKDLPAAKNLVNTFIFRYALAGYVLALRCIKTGGAVGASPENIRNSLVDAIFAAYATYFDGFLSKDNKAQEIYATTSELLKLFHQHFKAQQPETSAKAC